MIRIIAITALLALIGCETVDGFGRDVSSSARAVKRAL